MKLYNSLKRNIQEFTPISDDSVGLYSCGPTVYNNLHIGNLSAFIYADTLRRALVANGYKVKHVMNITDIDDKTIRDSKKNYPEDDPMTALKKLTSKYTNIFMDDLEKTGNDTSEITFISAVETINEMVELTQKLLNEKIAYIATDGIYFSIKAYKDSGQKYGLLQRVKTPQTRERVANDEYDKDSASDFALWKNTQDGEPSWPAEFTTDSIQHSIPGRPGWHIECSAMSEKLLGVPFDIHTGGIDLKFPHHENEIAQTRGSGSKRLANYFVHNNHILVDGRKMSKSLGNFHTLRDLEDKGFSSTAFRLLILESHYRKENNFSWEILTAAQNRYLNWQSHADLQWQIEASKPGDLKSNIAKALANDLNTPKALVAIDSYFDSLQKEGLAPSTEDIQAIQSTLGIDLNSSDASDDAKNLMSERTQARKNKDWDKSDKIRDDLEKLGYIVRDDTNGQIWSRI